MTIGASLGRLTDPPSGGAWDYSRLAMVDHLFAPEAGIGPSHAAWLGALELGAQGVVDQVILEASEGIKRAASFSRYPRARAKAKLPSGAYRELLLNRLLSAGMPLEALEAGDDRIEVQRQRGVALESAWEDVVRMAEAELVRWRGIALEVEEWRRPTAPLWIGSVSILGLAVLLAGWLGGFIQAPEWFAPIAEWVWR